MKKRPKSRRSRRRYRRRHNRLENEWWSIEEKKEEMKKAANSASDLATIARNTKLVYGFQADPTKTTLQNAATIFGDMPAKTYFNRPSNTAFHDRTGGKIAPNVRTLLGLGLKFCLEPKWSLGRFNINIKRLQQDIKRGYNLQVLRQDERSYSYVRIGSRRIRFFRKR